MLKKTRLQDSLMDEEWGNRKVPFKRNLLQEIKATLVADDSLDPSASRQSHTPTTIASTTKSRAELKQGAPPSDFELMAAMMQRITELENTLRSQAWKMDQKEKIISVLEEQLRSREESDIESEITSSKDLKKKCHLLQNRVQKMESFLSDYGLIWVGDGDSSDSEESQQPTSSGQSADRGFRMNFDLVLQRIRELNVLAGEGESFVQATKTGAKLAKKDPIRLKLYRNGIVMFDGPFRSYQEHSTQQCLQDLMDGYFPSELQQRFPDGVIFEVHDRRDEDFIFRLPWDMFTGDRQAVCGTESTNLVGFKSDRKLSTDQFLSKLPKMVVKAGNVINIRGSLRRTLQSSSDTQSRSSEILIDTAALQAMVGRFCAELVSVKETSAQEAKRIIGSCTAVLDISYDKPEAVITLKLKSEDGTRTYVMKMSLSETVGQLRGYLDRHRGEGQPGYDIISAYPRCSFNDDSRMLQSCGLSANATLLLRRRQQRY